MSDPFYDANEDAGLNDYDEPVCLRCGGSGELLICWDDLCHGAGECMHGDGEIECPTCGGSGIMR